MTNNPTIDGVLDAPAVERQPDAPAGSKDGGKVERLIALCLQKDAVISEMDRIYSALHDAATDCADTLYCQSSQGADALEVLRSLLKSGLPAAQPQSEPVACGQCGSTSADICNGNGCGYLESGNGEPEVAALQSTVAQLQARIAELENGRGEPVAYADPLAFENFKNHAHKGGPYLHEWMWAKPLPSLVPLFTAPPAPVAVVPDGWKLVPVDPTGFMNQKGDESYSWNVAKIYKAMVGAAPAYLDATAALNEVKP